MDDDSEIVFTPETDEYTEVPEDELIVYAIQQFENSLAAEEDDGEPGVLIKAVIVAEFINTDGRYVRTLRAPDDDGCSLWDAKGLMTHALQELEYDEE